MSQQFFRIHSLLIAAACILAAPAPADPGTVFRPVTVRFSGDRMAAVVPRLGALGGGEMRCGENSAARRVYLAAEARPLPEVMGQLKKTLAYPPGLAFWFKSGSGSIFDEDIASRQARERAVLKKFKERLQAGRKALDEMEKWSDFGSEPYPDTTAEDKAHIRKYKVAPIIRWKMNGWIRVVKTLPEDIRDRALLGTTVRIPVHRLPHSSFTALYRVLNTRLFKNHRQDSRAVVERQTRDLKRKTLILARGLGAPQRLPSLMVILQNPGTSGGGGSDELLVKPAGDAAGGADFATAYKQTAPENEKQRGPKNMEKIPLLQKRLRLPARDDGDMIAERLLPAISEASDRPLIGEFDPCADQALFTNDRNPRVALKLLSRGRQEMPLWEMLESACQEFDLDWDFRDGWIVITSPRREMGWAGWLDLSPTVKPDKG